MANRLKKEVSPYLLQHAENPVDWYPWSPDALEKARQEDKPIFLSIGYAACHWCHVMAHESFEDPDTARLMNDHFVNIKVDREERPELDQIYMDAVVAMTGQGGWPMSVFLTPDGRPFYGGTYFPPEPRYNMTAFREVLAAISQAWQNNRESILTNADQLLTHLNAAVGAATGKSELSAASLDKAALTLAQNYDWQNGGWGQAPKFPQPMLIEFLLQRVSRGDRMALEICQHALDAMAKGGMYDVIGGGFARYSTDNRWLVPHFEKMLYDNAQLARVYLFGYLLTGNEHYRQVCEQTLDFTLRELTHPDGGFFSSLDADSEGEEGLFYVWTAEQIKSELSFQTAEIFCRAFGVTESGNFEGRNVLQRAATDDDLAQDFDQPIEKIRAELSAAKAKLLQARSDRIRPGTDDKILTGWNGLMLRVMAEAAAYLGRSDYLEAAQKNAHFLLAHLQRDDRLLRAWREGTGSVNGFLEDYAGLILGLLALYQADAQPFWYQSARRLLDQMIELFADPEGGFFDTSVDHEQLIIRPKSVQDSAVPSGNSLAALALQQIGAFTGDNRYYEHFEGMWSLVSGLLERFPTAVGNWLVAGDIAIGPVLEVALIVPESASAQEDQLLAAFREKYRPRTVLARSTPTDASQGPPLISDRKVLGERTTAYVCQGFVCKQPVTSPAEFRQQLDDASPIK